MAARAAYAVDQGRERRAVYAATGGAKPLKSHQTPYHALRKAEPCKFESGTMDVAEPNHASLEAEPWELLSPTMQVWKSNHASLRRLMGVTATS